MGEGARRRDIRRRKSAGGLEGGSLTEKCVCVCVCVCDRESPRQPAMGGGE